MLQRKSAFTRFSEIPNPINLGCTGAVFPEVAKSGIAALAYLENGSVKFHSLIGTSKLVGRRADSKRRKSEIGPEIQQISAPEVNEKPHF